MARLTRAEVLAQFQLAGQDLMMHGLLSLQSGNLSVREGDSVFISRTRSRLDRLCSQDIVPTPLDRSQPGHPLASRKLPVRLAICAATRAVAIAHTHPPATIVLSLLTDPIVPRDSEGAMLLGEVPVIRAKQAIGSRGVGVKAARALRTHRVAMVAGHGSFAVGNSLEEAVSLTTSLEMSARVLLWSRLLKGSMGRARVSRNRPR